MIRNGLLAAIALVACGGVAWAGDVPDIYVQTQGSTGFYTSNNGFQVFDEYLSGSTGFSAAQYGFPTKSSANVVGGDVGQNLVGPSITLNVSNTFGTFAGAQSTLVYYTRVSGSYDPNSWINLHADVGAKLTGSHSAVNSDNGVNGQSGATAFVRINFFKDEAQQTFDFGRSTWDRTAGGTYAGSPASYSETLKQSHDFLVHPGELITVVLNASAFTYTTDNDGTGTATAYVDPFFYFDPGSSYSLAFSQGIVNAPVALGVPEASTWALLVLGFGLIGAGLRRRTHLGRVVAVALG